MTQSPGSSQGPPPLPEIGAAHDAGAGVEPPPIPGETSFVVTGDSPCLACGYNLKGLSVFGRCPECGASVERSLRGNLLQFADPGYVKRLHLGAIIVVLSAGLPLLGGVIVFAGQIAIAQFQGDSTTGVGSEALHLLAPILEFVGSGAALLGWWLFSEPDPAQVGEDDGEKTRRWLRVMLVVLIASALAQLVVALLPGAARNLNAAAGNPFSSGMGTTVLILLGVQFLSALVKATMMCIAAMYIRVIAKRIPSYGIESFAKVLVWLFPLLMTVGYLLCVGPLAAWVLGIVIMSQCWNQIGKVRRAIDVAPSANSVSPV